MRIPGFALVATLASIGYAGTVDVAPASTPPNAPSVVRPVYVTNFPNPQNVAGTVAVSNLHEVQAIIGAVEVTNLPMVQSIDGIVQVGNLPFSSRGNLRVEPAEIDEQIIDLLDAPVVLSVPQGGVPDVWYSEPFDTSRFNRVVRRFASSGSISNCQFEWKFTDDDEFVGAPQTPVSGRTVDSGIFGRQARVRCVPGEMPGGTLLDVKVLLRRE